MSSPSVVPLRSTTELAALPRPPLSDAADSLPYSQVLDSGSFEARSSVPTPRDLKRRLALSRAAFTRIGDFRRQASDIVRGQDPRLLAIVGPCSIHDPVAALEYAERLLVLARRFEDELLVCMRVYFEKPRTTVGWKGLINDPHLDDSCDLATGLWMARGVIRDVAELGLPAATELLDPNVAPYLTDLLSWAAIGARTTESQPHRELASSLALPVGFKNSTDGRVDSAINGLLSAAEPHTRLTPDDNGRVTLQRSVGNPHAHLVLRGGDTAPNYDAASVNAAGSRLAALGLPSRVLVDCSHANSKKNHQNQPRVLDDVAEQVASGSAHLLGVMIESHLVAGRQELKGGRSGLCYGQSITDGCVNLDDTERMLETLARCAQAGLARL
jgi:3-deoxy-7-phosphoheptulonate synthase